MSEVYSAEYSKRSSAFSPHRRRTTLRPDRRRSSTVVKRRSNYRARQSIASFGLAVDPLQGIWDEESDSEEELVFDNSERRDVSTSSAFHDLSLFHADSAADDKPLVKAGEGGDHTTERPTSLADEEDPSPVAAVADSSQELVKTQRYSGEEWKTVNTLFNYLDVDNSGTLDKEEIVEGLKAIGDKNLTRVLVDASSSSSDDVIDRETLYNMLFAPRESTRYQSAMLWLIIWILPLFYSASTRLPFISLALEVTVARGGSLLQTGILLGVYQTCRSTANLIISLGGGEHPMLRMQLPMVLAGFTAWTASFFLVEEGVWSLLAMAGVGLGEVVVNLQTALIEETRLESPAHVADPGVLSERLRSQYASISAGSFLAYVLGGSLYTYYGFQAVCAVGMACNALQLLGTLLYIAGYRHRATQFVDVNGVTGRELLRSITYRIQALLVLGKEAEQITTKGVMVDKPAIAQASKSAEQDQLLIGSIRKLYRAFFLPEDPLVDQEALKDPTSLRRASALASVPIRQMLKGAGDLKSRKRVRTDNNSSRRLSIVRRSGLNDADLAKVAARLIDTDGDGTISEKDFVSYMAPRVFLSFFGNMRLAAVSVVWPYLKFVVLTQAIMALCIGTFLSTSLLLYTTKFDVTASTVGILLGVGEGLGAVVIYISGVIRNLPFAAPDDERYPGFIAIITARPLHVPMVLLLLGIATMAYSADLFALAIVFQMIMSSINDLSVTLLNELIATSIPADKFMKYQGLGQWLRRLGNMTTGLLGPILFGIFPELPFLIFGGIVALWSFILWGLLYRHVRELTNEEDFPERDLVGKGPISAFRPTVLYCWHILEREYYAANKEELDERLHSQKVKIDLAVMDNQLRRLGAALRAEAAKREDLEKKLNREAELRSQLEAKLALFSKENVTAHEEEHRSLLPKNPGVPPPDFDYVSYPRESWNEKLTLVQINEADDSNNSEEEG